MTGSREELPDDEAAFLEDNISTVAFHLAQPGARMSVYYEGGSKLIVDPGEVLKEVARRLSAAAQGTRDPAIEKVILIARDVVWFDWSSNDTDAVHTIEQLRLALSALPSTTRGGEA